MLNMIKPRLYASSEDLANYVLGKKLSAHYQVFAVLEIDEHLDASLLILAAKWAYQAVPVLSCQLVLDGERPYWKRRLSCNRQELCSVVETQDVDYAIQSFMSVSLDPCQDALVQLRLVRKADRDLLCVKISHACSDAVGLKEYIATLAAAYNALVEGRAFVQKPFSDRRDLNLIMEHLGVKSYQEIARSINAMPCVAAGFPSLSKENSLPRWVKCSFDKNEYSKLRNYAAAQAATVNDALLTAFFRAYPKISGQLNTEYSAIVTADLRRFAKKVSPVANFSGRFRVTAASYEGESFTAALARVVHTTKKETNTMPGVVESLRWSEVLRLSYANFVQQVEAETGDLCPPFFANTGFFSPEFIFFGQAAVSKAYILPPPLFAPGFMLLVSTYNNILTISAGYYQPAVPKQTMDILLTNIFKEIRHCF
jgi:NRPS condensation-like uncharacterized protein